MCIRDSIHAHCEYAVVESLLEGPAGIILPLDSEGQYFLGDIPIVEGGIGSCKLADNLANALSRRRGAIVYLSLIHICYLIQ